MGTISIGANTYDVYGDSAGLKAYVAAKIGSDAYDNASSGDRKKAHVSATRWLDRKNWQGQKTDLVTPQALEFPRTGLTDKDGNSVDDAIIPDEMEEGCYELILVLLTDEASQNAVSSGSNIKQVKAGSAQVEWFKGTEDTSPAFPPQVHDLIKYFLEGYTAVTGVAAYGSDAESQFDDGDGYDLGQGMA